MLKYRFSLNIALPRLNLICPDYCIQNAVITNTNITYADANYQVTWFISVTPGDVYTGLKLSGSAPALMFKYVCYYDNDYAYMLGGLIDINQFTIPTGIRYIRLTFNSIAAGQYPANIGLFLGTSPTWSTYEQLYIIRYAYPIYKDDISKDYEVETQQKFFRSELSGQLSFIKEDYDWLMEQDFEEEIILKLDKSNDSGASWVLYYTGSFFKTDCIIDMDNKLITAKINTKDQYTKILDSQDTEYNLLKLTPAKTILQIDKRPLIQIYALGDTTISCFLGGDSWEQEVTDAVFNEGTLINDYHFLKIATVHEAAVSEVTGGPNVSGSYACEGSTQVMLGRNNLYYVYDLVIKRVSDDVTVFNNAELISENKYRLYGIPGISSGTISLYFYTLRDIYARYILDVTTFGGNNTYNIPVNDIVENNRNYKKCIGYNVGTGHIKVYNYASSFPTSYGLTTDGLYFQIPPNESGYKYYPVVKSRWSYYSTWFRFVPEDLIAEQTARKTYTMKDSMLLSEVLKVLLKEIDITLSHEATVEYSQFLYDTTNPITGEFFRLMITSKSNILAGEYDTPAQKAPITLGDITKMLRDCFRCFWYIEDNKFKIEHVSWFRNGGSYSPLPVYNADLTTLIQRKNNKTWGYVSSNYTYDKSNMAEKYTFDWPDDVTETFEGLPIIILSNHVQKGKTESISISNFTTDVDYMLLNSSAISSDGFALFAAILDGSVYKLPYIDLTLSETNLRAQNGFMSWVYLQPHFYIYDLPSTRVNINGQDFSGVLGIEKNKKQKVSYPSLEDPNPLYLIKTYIGDGQIGKLSVNLQSRLNDIELKYDTE